jgi:hypothetical protein
MYKDQNIDKILYLGTLYKCFSFSNLKYLIAIRFSSYFVN